MRSYEESCALLDRIVGRCVRDAEFGESVLEDPLSALADYELEPDEMDDFTALRAGHRDGASRGWSEIREAMAELRRRRLAGQSPAQMRSSRS